MFEDKKAQIGETLTWIVATVIIIVILLVAIFVASVIGKDKNFNKNFPSSNNVDLFAKKSLTAYLLTENNLGVPVYKEIEQTGNLNDFNGKLAKAIFYGLYSEDYSKIWLGVYTPNEFSKTKVNDYFKGVPYSGRGLSDKVQLNKDKYLLLILTKSN